MDTQSTLNIRTITGNEPATKQFTSPNGKTVASIIRVGKLFRFVEESQLCEPRAHGLDGYCYWSETYRSGLYGSLHEALAAARSELPWLASAS